MTSIATASYYASSSTPRASHRRQPSAWQMVVLPRPSRSVSAYENPNGIPPELRIDAPHASILAPHYLLNWSDIVGVHPHSALEPIAEPLRALKLEARVDSGHVRATAERDMAQLLAEAAHEVRTPIAGALQALMMVTQRAPGQVLEPRELDLLRAAQVRLMQANRWAEDILCERNLNALPSSVRQRFYPDQWRQELMHVVQTAADKHQIQLIWEGWDRSLPRMYLDVNQLSRVVMNLIINAIQASPKGATVVVRAASQSNLSQRLLVSIEDRGLGMDSQLMRQINSSQPWPTTSARSEGLGLRTVKTLTEAMGGSVSVQRGALGGTIFRLAFPVDDLRLLVRQWIMRGSVQQRLHPATRLAIYSISASEMDAQLVDRQLQQAASESEFVYRIAKNQWLWLHLIDPASAGADDIHSLASRLNEFGQRSNNRARCQADLMCHLHDLPFTGAVGSNGDASRLRSLLETINGHAQRLMDGRVPPLDLVTTEIQAPLVPSETTGTTAPQPSSAKGEVTTRTIQEVAKQWRMIHSKLEKLHSRHLRSAPAM